MSFINIPLEVYGIILNYMENPLKLSLVNKVLYYLMNKSEYGGCYYKKFKYNRKYKLVAKEYAYVTILDVSCSNITDDQLKQFPNLQELDCWCCQKITDKSIIELKQLQKLNCSNCSNITDKSIIELKKINPQLKVVNDRTRY